MYSYVIGLPLKTHLDPERPFFDKKRSLNGLEMACIYFLCLNSKLSGWLTAANFEYV